MYKHDHNTDTVMGDRKRCEYQQDGHHMMKKHLIKILKQVSLHD